MKRRAFFEKLGLGAASVIIAPKVIEASDEVLKEKTITPPSMGEKDFIHQYPMTVEECYVAPRFCTVTKSPKEISKGVYGIGISDEARTGFNLYIPAKCTNKKSNQMVVIIGGLIGGNYTNVIMPYNQKAKINGIKIGTKLAIGASSYRE